MSIKNILRGTIVTGALMLGGIAGGLLAPQSVSATDAKTQVTNGVNAVGGGDNKTDLTTFITNIINVLLFVIGAVAVIMIIIGGIRYTTSNGDASSAKGARDTILYAVVGLVIALLAYAIVNFVLTNIIK